VKGKARSITSESFTTSWKFLWSYRYCNLPTFDELV